MTDPNAVAAKLSSEVALYRGTPQAELMANLLKSLGECYAEDLLHCTADELAGRQAAAKQVKALRDVVLGFDHANARI